MVAIEKYALRLRFSGGEADHHRLELYDGTTSLHGFAQAIQIATHAYLNKEVVSRATALKGAKFFIKAPRDGSLIFDIISEIEKYPALVTIAAPIFYDFLKYSFKIATGALNARADTPYVSKLSTKDEPFFDELGESMEGSLQRAHRAIDCGVAKITLERPRSKLVTFDASTSDWVNTREEDKSVDIYDGNITRYNSVTGNGRAYISRIGKIVPFRPAEDFPSNKRGLLTWSLHGNTIAGEKQLRLYARKIQSARGEIKRLVLSDCSNMPDQ